MEPFIIELENGREVRNCHFTFKCSRTWAGLRRTKDHKVRHCSDCQKKVYLVTNEDELRDVINEKQCAAVMGNHYDEHMGEGLTIKTTLGFITEPDDI